MPELPEVEVVRLFLESSIQNRTIKKIDILTPKSFVGNPKDILNQPIIKFTRVGKQLSIHFANHKIALFHLKMTGQLVYINQTKTILGHPTPNLNNVQLPNRATRIIFTFSDNSILFFNDQRKFGWVKIFDPVEIDIYQQNLGIDILSPQFTSDYFYQQLQRTSRPIKLALLDQQLFAGIGNIYANDSLFLTKIHPTLPAKKITFAQASTLRQNLIKIMTESVQHGGSTAKDNGYIKPDGTYGEHQFHFQVYQREGETCSVCQTKISRLKQGGRSTFYCPNCQKLSD